MPKISTSLAIAFAVHILIIVVSTFLIDKGPSPFLLDTKNAINVQFGSLSGGSSPKKSTAAPQTLATASTKTTPTLLSTTQGATSGQANASEKGNGTGSGSGTGTGSGDGNGTYDFGNSAVSYKEPTYPRLAIKRELQGSVRIRVKVSPEGKPTNTEILKSSGHELLDKAALEAVPFWQFQPKTLSYFVEKTIVFQLKN